MAAKIVRFKRRSFFRIYWKESDWAQAQTDDFLGFFGFIFYQEGHNVHDHHRQESPTSFGTMKSALNGGDSAIFQAEGVG